MPTTRKIVKVDGKYRLLSVHLLVLPQLISEDADKEMRKFIEESIRKAKRKKRG